ncbi:hypothetical protein MLD38_021212 [Melastoma candidum]|uniref:Uncharacterized protein n=1 Tax=Melastoma candidum TaxID=119954 RepID=A0ACB9QFM5_9MYRT|nr:hypothetical protein MLD38_021212 [Melastoma candidum]
MLLKLQDGQTRQQRKRLFCRLGDYEATETKSVDHLLAKTWDHNIPGSADASTLASFSRRSLTPTTFPGCSHQHQPAGESTVPPHDSGKSSSSSSTSPPRRHHRPVLLVVVTSQPSSSQSPTSPPRRSRRPVLLAAVADQPSSSQSSTSPPRRSRRTALLAAVADQPSSSPSSASPFLLLPSLPSQDQRRPTIDLPLTFISTFSTAKNAAPHQPISSLSLHQSSFTDFSDPTTVSVRHSPTSSDPTAATPPRPPTSPTTYNCAPGS